jgi:hypothetical protein
MESLEQTKAGRGFKSTKSERGRLVALPGFAITELRRHSNYLQAECVQRCAGAPWSFDNRGDNGHLLTRNSTPGLQSEAVAKLDLA